jgi:hypothetical protein
MTNEIYIKAFKPVQGEKKKDVVKIDTPKVIYLNRRSQ